MNALSFHYMPNHRHTQYLQAFSDLQPNIALIMDGSQNDYMEVRKRVPGCKILMRSYDWSDGGLSVHQRVQSDPIGTGRWMANNWINRAREWGGIMDPALTYFTGVNEYSVIPGVPIPPFVTCEAEFARTLAGAGLRACIGDEGVGHPSGVRDGWVDWSQYGEWESVIRQTQSILGVHEYWLAANGPRMNVKPEDAAAGKYWYAWRFMQCPFDVPIAITEWGVDQKVDAPSGTPSHGWQGLLEPNAYADQLREYIQLAVGDQRFVGATIFCHDYASDEWATYDTERGLNEIVNAARSFPPVGWYVPGGATPEPGPEPLPPDPGTPTPGAITHPLPAGSYRITQHFNQAREAYASGRHNGTDFGAAQGTPVLSMAAGVVAWADYDKDYGNYVRVWHVALGVHSFYAHLAQRGVNAGDNVAAGQLIGAVGSTGYSTGPHLHLEIRIADASGEYSETAPMSNGRCDPETWSGLLGLSLVTGISGAPAATVYMPLISA